MKATKKSGKNTTKTTKIAYPKTNVTVLEQATKEITNSLQGTINSSYSQTNLYQENERLKQQIDEIKTNQLSSQNSTSGASVDISPLENAISQNASDIDSLQTNVSTNANNISTLQQNVTTNTISIANNSNAITNLQNSKQDKLTAGNNISISNGVISATDTTYTAGQNISINANNVINAIDTKYFAGTNVTIDQNNVISATCTTAGEQDLQEINQQLAELKKQVGILNGTYDENRLSGEFVQYPDGTIITTSDTYERELDITSNYSISLPNIFFGADTTIFAEENGEHVSNQAYADIDFDISFIPTNTTSTSKLYIYINGTIVASPEQEYTNDQLGQEIHFTYTLQNYLVSLCGNHIYLSLTHTNSSACYKVTNMKIVINAPNTMIYNKVEPFDVQFNYYTNKYYLSDCSNGTVMLAEVDASNIKKTSDIVWQNTGIVAQNYQCIFATNESNGNYILGDKFEILNCKDGKIKVVDSQNNVLVLENIATATPILTKENHLTLACMQTSNKSFSTVAYKFDTNLTPLTRSFYSGGKPVYVCGINNYLPYFDFSTAIDTIATILQPDKNGRIVVSTSGGFENIGANNVQLVKPYFTYFNSSYDFGLNVVFKYFDCFYRVNMIRNISGLTASTPTKLGKYDNFFLGAHNDYFCVVDGQLKYFKFD